MPTYSDEDLRTIAALEGWQHAGERTMAESWLRERAQVRAQQMIFEPVAIVKSRGKGVIVEWTRYSTLQPGDKLGVIP